MSEATDGQFDIKLFQAVVDREKEVKKTHKTRDEINQRMHNLYWMIWGEEKKTRRQMKNVKVTRSPRARNAVKGAAWLLAASDPIISVPNDVNVAQVDAQSSPLELFAKATWHAAGRVRGNPIHYDMITSGLTFAEVNVGIESMDDRVKYAEGGPPAALKNFEHIREQTPYMYHPYSPMVCSPVSGSYGLEEFYRTRKITCGVIEDQYGSRGKLALDKIYQSGWTRYQACKLKEGWDRKWHHVWLEGGERPILQSEFNLPFIPVVSQVVDGSTIWEDPGLRREPFLYTLDKSGLLERQNLVLTVLYTLTFAMGANPLFVYTALNPQRKLEVDYSKAGGTAKIMLGESLRSLAKDVIDPSLINAWQMAVDLEEQSTIYRQTLGEPLGANAPYSMVALLGQSGRLPLTMPQRKISWAIGELMQKSFLWMIDKKVSGRAQYYDESQRNALIDEEVDWESIPENVQVVANLDIALPQDQLQQANIVSILKGFMSDRWLREKVLGHGQSDQMTQEIWGEQVGQIKFDAYVQREMAKEMGPPGAGGEGGPIPKAPLPYEQGPPPEQVQPSDVEPNPFPPLTPLPPLPPPNRQVKR